MIVYFFFFHMVHWFIFGQGWLLGNFCKACQNCLCPSFEFVQCSTQCSADAWIVALSWKLPQMPSCSANDANLDKNNFDMFMKFIAVQPSMAKYEWTMYQMEVQNYAIMLWNQCCYICFRFWEIWSQTRVSFKKNSHCILCAMTNALSRSATNREDSTCHILRSRPTSQSCDWKTCVHGDVVLSEPSF